MVVDFYCVNMLLLVTAQLTSRLDDAPPCVQTPQCCDSGFYTLDVCGCCLTCAKPEGAVCGGPFRIAGQCAAGLRCLRQCSGPDFVCDDDLFNERGSCVNGNNASDLLRFVKQNSNVTAAVLDNIPSGEQKYSSIDRKYLNTF